MRLTDTQRAVLNELAHMRVTNEHAIMTTLRLAQLAGFTSRSVLLTMENHGLIERAADAGALIDVRWRITNQGREALTLGGSP